MGIFQGKQKSRCFRAPCLLFAYLILFALPARAEGPSEQALNTITAPSLELEQAKTRSGPGSPEDPSFENPTDSGSVTFEYDDQSPNGDSSDESVQGINQNVIAAERSSLKLDQEIQVLNKIYDYEIESREKVARNPEAVNFKDRIFQYKNRGDFLDNVNFLIISSKEKITDLSSTILQKNAAGIRSADNLHQQRELQRLNGSEVSLLNDVKDLVKFQLAFDTNPVKELNAIGVSLAQPNPSSENRLPVIEKEKLALAKVERQLRLNLEITEKLGSYLIASGHQTSAKTAGISVRNTLTNRNLASLADATEYISSTTEDSLFSQINRRYQAHFQAGHIGKYEAWRSGAMILFEP